MTRRWRRNSAQHSSDHVIVISLSILSPFLSDAWTTVSFLERRKNGAFRYDVSVAFLRSALLPIIILGVLTGYPLQRVVNEARQCQPVGSSKPQNCISHIKMGNWSTCNVTTRGSIYDTSSHYWNRQIVRLFIISSTPKQVRERDGRGGSINDLILPSRPFIPSLGVPHLATYHTALNTSRDCPVLSGHRFWASVFGPHRMPRYDPITGGPGAEYYSLQ